MQPYLAIIEYLELNSPWPVLAAVESAIILCGIEKTAPLIEYIKYYSQISDPDAAEKLLNGEYRDALKMLTKVGAEWPLVRIQDEIITVAMRRGSDLCKQSFDLADPGLFVRLDQFLDSLKSYTALEHSWQLCNALD